MDGERVLVNYGDLVSILPSTWANALPSCHHVKVLGQVYAPVQALSRLLSTDAIDQDARKALAKFLNSIPELLKEVNP